MSRIFAIGFLLILAAPALAHPVPRGAHDRTVNVRLTHDATTGQIVVTVAYRLEVEELTVALVDMVPFLDEVDFSKYRNRQLDFYAEYTRLYAPILARNLDGTLDGKPLKFECVKRSETLRDEEGQALGHLRCDFQFRAAAPLTNAAGHVFKFREGNWLLQPGDIDVSLSAGGGVELKDVTQASDTLKKLPRDRHAPGDDEKLRSVSATVTAADAAPAPAPPPGGKSESGGTSLLRLFFESDGYAVWLLLILAVVFGAAHALTPGHGKTLVAAYLIGERGTVWHALVLGLVTTFTHTFAVILLAVCLLIFGSSAQAQQAMQTGLGLAMGLAVVCVGVWLLLLRLSGRADHVHIGGGHHHHHGEGQHHHHHASDAGQRAGTWGLILLGIQGGLVPCWDAIAMLFVAVQLGQVALAVPLLIAFSLGLAGVLVAIGILVVRSKRFAESRWGEGRLVRALPIVSAVLVTALGVWMCYEAVQHPPGAATAPVGYNNG